MNITPDTIRHIIAEELDRRPVVHLHIQVPADASDPTRLADTIARIISDFQTQAPPAPAESTDPGKPG